MTEPTATQTAQSQATSDGGQNQAQPTAEERLKQMETEKAELTAKYEASVREMNDKQRRAAELEARLFAEETMRSSAQAQLAQFQTKADPTVEIQNRIRELQEAGDVAGASKLIMDLQAAQSAQMVQSAAAVGLMNTVNQALRSSDLTPEAKAVLREMVFEGGDPKKNIRQDKYGELLATSVKPGAFDELIEIAKERAEGRKMLSGKTKEQLFQEWTAEQEKRKKEAEMQSSLTQGASGAPPVPETKEQIKLKDDALRKAILEAQAP